MQKKIVIIIFLTSLFSIFVINCHGEFTDKLSKRDNIYANLNGMWYFERPDYYSYDENETAKYYRNYIQFEGTKNFIFWGERENGYYNKPDESSETKSNGSGGCSNISDSYYNDTQVPIPENDPEGGAVSVISIDNAPDNNSDISVRLTIYHPAVEQLSITLKSPVNKILLSPTSSYITEPGICPAW